MPPWSTIAPTQDPRAGFMSRSLPFLPGPWFAMHAGKHIGGRPGNEGALGDMIATAREAGWHATVWHDDVLLSRGEGDDCRTIRLHPARIVTSAIVAMMRVTRVAYRGVGGPWRFPDQFGWYVDVRPLPRPVPCKGAQGLWTVPDDVSAQVLAQAGVRGEA